MEYKIRQLRLIAIMAWSWDPVAKIPSKVMSYVTKITSFCLWPVGPGIQQMFWQCHNFGLYFGNHQSSSMVWRHFYHNKNRTIETDHTILQMLSGSREESEKISTFTMFPSHMITFVAHTYRIYNYWLHTSKATMIADFIISNWNNTA